MLGYSLEKMHMLEFYYDFFNKFFDRTKFELAQMDTNSLYFIISGESPEAILLPGLWFFDVPHILRNLWLPSEDYSNCKAPYVAAKVDNKPWLLKHSCGKQRFDKHTAVLFKLEFHGDGILSLCSKSYICVSLSGNRLPHKDVSAAQYLLCLENNKKVLKETTQMANMNKGVWALNKVITT